MFSVIFEVQPKTEQWDAYLGYAKRLRPELEKIDGFVDNVRYRSLTREGWLLSLSGWRDEKSVVRWRTHAAHHEVQAKGRDSVFQDYHLRVGQVTYDTAIPEGEALKEQRLDETEVGDSTTVVLIDGVRDADWVQNTAPAEIARFLQLDPAAQGLVSWDVFDAVLSRGEIILLTSWKEEADAKAFQQAIRVAQGSRVRQVRVVRDYGMFDRREAPQYYSPVAHNERRR